MGDATRRMPRLTAAALGVFVALCALTCHESTHFHLLEQASVALASASAPAQLDLPGLSALDLANHPTMRSQALTAGDLRALRPYAVTLSITGPATGQDLTFFHAVHLTLSAPGHDPVVVARGADFATGTNSVGLEVEDVELLAQARTRALTAQLVLDAADAPPQPVQLQVSVTFAVDVAQPKGSCG